MESAATKSAQMNCWNWLQRNSIWKWFPLQAFLQNFEIPTFGTLMFTFYSPNGALPVSVFLENFSSQGPNRKCWIFGSLRLEKQFMQVPTTPFLGIM